MTERTEYITYMEVSLYSEGAAPKKLTDTLAKLGWEPIYGKYDYAYKWGADWGNKAKSFQEFFGHLNKTHAALEGFKVIYSLRTFQRGKEDFQVMWSEKNNSS